MENKNAKYGKLVRDRIPEIIEANGDTPIIRILDNQEYRKALETKLEEEKNEVLSTKTSEERVEELADMLEVIFALSAIEGKDEEATLEVMKTKRKKRGAFNSKIYLETVVRK